MNDDFEWESAEYSYNDIQKTNIKSTKDIDDDTFNQNNGWNYQIEMDAKRIGEKSGGLRWMHNYASSVFRKRYWAYTIISIVLSAIIVVFNSITGAECSTDSSDHNKIISIVGGALLGIVTVYGSVKNYGARVTSHQVLEGNFLALFYTIKNQLHLNPKDRQFGKDFIEWVQKEYTDLSSNPDTPNLPGFIQKRYLDKIQGTDMSKYNDVETIQIKKNSPPRLKLTTQPHTQFRPHTITHSRTHPHTTKHSHTRPHQRRRPQTDIRLRPRPRTTTLISENSDSDKFTVTIPNGTSELSAKDKWQLSRFYGEK